MADVALATGRLVGDDAEACSSRRRSRRSSGPRRRAGPGQRGRPVVVELPDRHRSLAARRAMALAVSIAEPPPTGTTTVPSSPKRAGPPRRAPRSRRPGSARLRRSTPASTPAACEHAHDRSTTPDRRTPGSVTTKTREPPTAATTSGSRAIDPTPNSTRFRRVDLEPAVGQGRQSATSSTASSASCRAGPSASAGSRRRGTSARSRRRPGSRTPRPRRSRARPGPSIQSGTARRSPPNVNSSRDRRPQRGQIERVHQRVPDEPWSARTMVAP